MEKIDWKGFYSKLNEQERDAIIVITLNKIIDWINDYEKLQKDEEDPDYHIRGRSIK